MTLGCGETTLSWGETTLSWGETTWGETDLRRNDRNCATPTRFIRADLHTYRGLMVDQMTRVAKFSCGFFTTMARGRLYVALCYELMEKVRFSGSKTRPQFCTVNESIAARACYSRKFLRLL